jgi:hypothetical protein
LDDSRLNTSMNKTEPIATVAANHLGSCSSHHRGICGGANLCVLPPAIAGAAGSPAA